ncbi:hypothetical protein H9P43_002907 [Blastocladiella emersonii ATCC 22665]|nr:hypothetical protein H9P43_002907 [Blastocladiella emersonii ATCC 22665]
MLATPPAAMACQRRRFSWHSASSGSTGTAIPGSMTLPRNPHPRPAVVRGSIHLEAVSDTHDADEPVPAASTTKSVPVPQTPMRRAAADPCDVDTPLLGAVTVLRRTMESTGLVTPCASRNTTAPASPLISRKRSLARDADSDAAATEAKRQRTTIDVEMSSPVSMLADGDDEEIGSDKENWDPLFDLAPPARPPLQLVPRKVLQELVLFSDPDHASDSEDGGEPAVPEKRAKDPSSLDQLLVAAASAAVAAYSSPAAAAPRRGSTAALTKPVAAARRRMSLPPEAAVPVATTFTPCERAAPVPLTAIQDPAHFDEFEISLDTDLMPSNGCGGMARAAADDPLIAEIRAACA